MLIIYFSIVYCLFRWYFYIYPKFILHIELIVLLVAFVICSFFRNPSKIAYAIFLTVPLFFMSNYRCINEVFMSNYRYYHGELQTNIKTDELESVPAKEISYPYSKLLLATPMPFISTDNNKIIYTGTFTNKPEQVAKAFNKFIQWGNGEMLVYYKEQELSKPSSSLLLSLFPHKEKYSVLYKTTNKDGTKELGYDFESTLYSHVENKAAYKKVIVILFTISLLCCLLLFVLNRIVNFLVIKD